MKKIVYLIFSLFAFSSAHSGQIGIDAFSGSESIEDFSSLGFAPGPGPFSFGGMTFSEASSGGGGPGWRLIGNKTLSDNDSLSKITIDFDNPFSRIGLDVGFFHRTGHASYDVSFFDTSLNLLGVVSVAGVGGLFAGWEDFAGISRIHIFEVSGRNGHVGGIDNIRFENIASSIPEPTSIALLGLGLAGIGFFFEKKAVLTIMLSYLKALGS